jgi:hypothetical protein
MTPRAGVAVDVRVFPVTDDRSRVRSAVQLEVRPRENDLAQVSQVYQVFVEGEEAFWPGKGGLEIRGPDDAKSLVVLRPAQAWLAEKEGAPFATLDGPIPPGEVANLSVAYLIPHDGELEITWNPPFPLVESSVILGTDLELVSPSVEPTKPQHATAEDIRFYPLGERPQGASITFVVGKLPVRPSVFRWIALGLGVVLTMGVAVAVWRRPRRTERDRLEARRRELERLLATASGDERERVIAALDDVYRRLDAVDGDAAAAPAAAD